MDTFYSPEPDDADPVRELWRMDNEARMAEGPRPVRNSTAETV